MLIFGASGGDWRQKAAYASDKADNELAEVREVRCEAITDVDTALAFMAALAADTRCKKFLYHATINLYRGERLSREQWMKAIDRLEKNLGLAGHYRIAFEHIKKGRQHYHIYWLRLPPTGKTGPAVTMSNNYRIHAVTAMALEKEFGLKPAPRREKGKPSKKKEASNNRNSKTRVDPDVVTMEVTRLFHESKTAKDFVENLAKHGYTLTRGKGSKLVLVDKQGGWHGLLRRIDGVKIKDVRQKFPELETMALPSLNAVLRNRRPPSVQSFRKAARSLSRSLVAPRHRSYRSYKAGHNPYLCTAQLRSIIAIVSQARAHHPKGAKKYYPPPYMRKRRSKPPDENKLAKAGLSRAEIESAELLRWAWHNNRYDVLEEFGFSLPFETPEP